jgi:hypothetical protein
MEVRLAFHASGVGGVGGQRPSCVPGREAGCERGRVGGGGRVGVEFGEHASCTISRQ